MAGASLAGGFACPSIDAAHAFRAILGAMAEPGTIVPMTGAAPPAPMPVAAGALALTLCDPSTPLVLMPSLDGPALRAWLAFHTGAPIAPPETAQFVFGDWHELSDFGRFRQGDPAFPDRSATLVITVDALVDGGAVLRGPGIEDHRRLSLPDLAPFQANAARYPLGVDVILVAGAELAAVPRTVRVEAG